MVSLWPRARANAADPVSWWKYLLAGLSHGVLMLLALPPASLWPLVFVAIVPLVWAGCRAARKRKRAAFWTAAGVVPIFLVQHLWLINVTAPGFPLIAVYLSVYVYLFVWAIGVARATDWPIPMTAIVSLLWTALEVLRGDLVLTGYSFNLLGHPLIEVPSLAAPAAVLGAYAVSFLTAGLAGALADAAGWSGLPRHSGGVGAAAALLLWFVLSFAGERTGRPGPSNELRVAAVQTNIPQDNKISWSIGQRLKDFKRFAELTRLAAAQRPEPDVILWPETMFPGFALNEDAVRAEREAALVYRLDDPAYPPGSSVPATVFFDDLLKLEAEIGIPMVVGAIAADGLKVGRTADSRITRESTHRYNSVFLIHRGGVLPQRYDKVELTPFGEVIPYLWRWPTLQQRVLSLGAQGMSFDLAMGRRLEPLSVPLQRGSSGVGGGGATSTLSESRPRVLRCATPICFEVTKAQHCRNLVNNSGASGDQAGRAGVIFNLSNDGWFTFFDPGRQAHLLAARWRCVEMGVPMVRAVNTGISAAIDRRGRIIAQSLTGSPASAGTPAGASTQVDGVLVSSVPIQNDPVTTIFARVGQMPAYAMTAGVGVGLFVLWKRRRRLARLGT